MRTDLRQRIPKLTQSFFHIISHSSDIPLRSQSVASAQASNCFITVRTLHYTWAHASDTSSALIFWESSRRHSRISTKWLSVRRDWELRPEKSELQSRHWMVLILIESATMPFTCSRYNVAATRYLASMFLILNLTKYIFKCTQTINCDFANVFALSLYSLTFCNGKCTFRI